MGEPWSSAPPPQQPWGAPAPAPSAANGAKKRPVALLGGVSAIVLAAGIGGFFVGQATASNESSSEGDTTASATVDRSPVEDAYRACSRRDIGGTLSLEDDGETLVVDTESEYGDPTGMACVLEELDTPSSITAQMDRTTSMMGVQEAEDGGIEYSWSYHPDNGVDMVITESGASSK